MHAVLLFAALWMQDGSIVSMAKIPVEHPLAGGAEQAALVSEANRGQEFLLGDGVPVDLAHGVQLLEDAARQGLGWADFLLGNLYSHGLGAIHVDHPRAADYFKAGAKLGDAQSEAEMGWMYATGFQVTKDDRQAVRWDRAAAAQGDAAGEFGLAVQFYQGRGVPRDLEQAEHWYRLAADQGHADAAYDLGLLYARTNKSWPHPPNWPLAAHYFTVAANQDLYAAQCMLGQLYAAGVGVGKDQIEALRWMTLSLEGSRRCEGQVQKLERGMSAEDKEMAAQLAGRFVPQPHLLTYGRHADH